jgi:hypothetical protein
MLQMGSITEQYLNKLYEDLQKEQMNLMNDMNSGVGLEKEKDLTKQMTQLNSLLINVLRYRNLRKTIQQKINC